jgi:PPM family protein phosphatase
MNLSPATPVAKLAAWFMRRTAPSGVRRVAPLKGAVASDIGSVRDENQDRVALVRGCDRSGDAFILAALADGIGGMKKGGECAAVTLATFIESIVTDALLSSDPRDWLARGAYSANRAVHARHIGDGGSTLVAVLLAKGRPPLWLSIGDSRVFQAGDGKLHQLSRDDTLEGQLGKPNEGRRPDLLQFVGIGDVLEPHIEVISGVGGTILLTTDGVHFIDADYLAKVVHHAPDLGLCARRLTELAKLLGGPDNASVAALSLDALAAIDAETYLDGSYEVWDPFGDLQVIFDRGPRRYASTSPQKEPAVGAPKPPAASPVLPAEDRAEKAAPGSADHDVAPEQQSTPKGKPQQKKSKGSRKKRKESLAAGEERGAADVPQFLIEFPNKAS